MPLDCVHPRPHEGGRTCVVALSCVVGLVMHAVAHSLSLGALALQPLALGAVALRYHLWNSYTRPCHCTVLACAYFASAAFLLLSALRVRMLSTTWQAPC